MINLKKFLRQLKLINVHSQTLYRQSRSRLKSIKRSLLILTGLNYTLGCLIFLACVLPNLELLAHRIEMQSVLPNYHLNPDYFVLSLGLALSFLLTLLPVQQFVARLNLGSHFTSAAKLSSSSWICDLLLVILFRMLVFGVLVFGFILLNMVHFTWVDHETIAFVLYGIVSGFILFFVFNWTNLIYPAIVINTFDFWQAFTATFKLAVTHFWLLLCLQIWLLPWTVLSYLTGCLAEIYVRPLKLMVYSSFLKAHLNESRQK